MLQTVEWQIYGMTAIKKISIYILYMYKCACALRQCYLALVHKKSMQNLQGILGVPGFPYTRDYDIIFSACSIWFWVQDEPSNAVERVTVYGSTVLLGAGGSTLLVTSLSMVADLIGNTVVRTLCTLCVCVYVGDF